MSFSIIIPLYNKVSSIEKTVLSAVNQSFAGCYEIIVIDDGSSDGGGEIVKRMKVTNLTLIRQKNRGVSTARNNGVRAAKYDYLVFLDGDDLIAKDYLSHIYQLIGRYPQAGAFGCGYQYMKNGRQIPSRVVGLGNQMLLINDYFKTASKGDLPIVASGVCIPRYVFEKVGLFPIRQTQGEDQDLWSRIGLAYPIAVHPAVDITYILDADNRVSLEIIPKKELAYSRNLQKQLDKKIIPNDRVKTIKRYIASHLIHLAKLNYLCGRLTISSELLNDPRTKKLPLRRIKWKLALAAKKICYALRGNKELVQNSPVKMQAANSSSDIAMEEESERSNKLKVFNLLNDKKMGGILSVVDSLSKSGISEKIQFDFSVISPNSWLRTNANSEVVMVHYASSWATVIPNLITRLVNYKAKLILQEHHYTRSFENCVPSSWRFRLMLKLNYMIFDNVVAVSIGQAEWINDSELLPAKKLVTIQQCRELSSFLQVARRKPHNTITIAAYGRLEPAKGFDDLIEAFNRVDDPRLTLIIAGDGPSKLDLQKIAKGNHRISFVGRISDVPAFLAQADLVVIPSRTEAFGLVCLEAKAAGRAVIVSDIDGLREQVTQGSLAQTCGQIISGNSIEAISEVIQEVPEMPLSEWGDNGRVLVRHAWNNYQISWKEFLLQLRSCES